MRVLKPKLFTMSAPDQLDLFRAIVKNNGISHLNIEVEIGEHFLARALVNLGLFASTSQVKKNRPELFRQLVDGETVKVGRFNLTLHLASVQ